MPGTHLWLPNNVNSQQLSDNYKPHKTAQCTDLHDMHTALCHKAAKSAMCAQGHMWADLECSFDVIIHHLDVGLVHTDGTAGQATGLVDGRIVQLWAVVPALLQDQ